MFNDETEYLYCLIKDQGIEPSGHRSSQKKIKITKEQDRN